MRARPRLPRPASLRPKPEHRQIFCARRHSSTTTGSAPAQTQTFEIPDGSVVFSGIQPSGIPHLGNYLGALRQWRRLQDGAAPSTRLLFSVVDLHAITMPQNADILRQWRRQALAALLAVGLNPAMSVIFYQSAVPAHSELMWILSCNSSTGYLSRMTQWKSKLELGDDNKLSLDDKKVRAKLKLGLFSYPVLQAADILVHRATHVPVGQDQTQHLEFARECAVNFNAIYGKHLIEPETIISPTSKVMSLRDPTQKMSKSHPHPRSRIQITDSAEEIRDRVRAAVTDSTGPVTYDPAARPGVANLLELLSVFGGSGRSAAELGGPGGELAGATIQDLKAAVADTVVEGLAGVRESYLELLERDGGRYIDEVAMQGAVAARANAERTMEVVRAAVGLA